MAQILLCDIETKQEWYAIVPPKAITGLYVRSALIIFTYVVDLWLLGQRMKPWPCMTDAVRMPETRQMLLAVGEP